MQRIRQIGLLIAAVLSVCALAVMPVAAEGSDAGSSSGSGDSSNTSTTTDQSGSGSSTTSGSHDGTETTTETSTNSTETENEVHTLEDKAKTMLETDRKNGKEQNQQQRQASCKAHQAEINNRVSDYAAAAQRHLTVFEGILTKVQSFYTSKNLSVSNYATLLATAQSKQADAQTAVDALKALDVSIDCTQPDPAQSVATVKTAVSSARTALQAYRTAIKDLIVAIQGASSAQNNTQTTTGGNQ